MTDLLPVPLAYKELNLANHLTCIEYANLGPADPRQPSVLYWGDKMEKWQVPEGVARTRLCMNCAHYDNSPEVLAAMPSAPGAQLKASDLPVTPKWADIDGMPAAICTMWAITCSALRTCDTWENPNTDPDNANVSFVTPTEKTES
jgi:hypothetical protein